MTKLRLVAAVALLIAGLLGAFGAPVQANPYAPWCYEDYQQCIASGEDFSICYCYLQMCNGGICP